MSALPAVVDAWIELVRRELPRVRVSGEPPAENAASTCIYLARYESTFTWQCLGSPEDQEERIRLAIVAMAYKERSSQRDAARAARVRLMELLDGVRSAVMDIGDPQAHQLSGTVSIARIARWQIDMAGIEKGWVATGRAVLEATYWP